MISINNGNTFIRSSSRLISRRLVVLALCSALPIFWGISYGTEPEKIDPDEFLIKYRQAFRDLESLYSNVQVEAVVVTTRPPRASTKKNTGSATEAVNTKADSSPGGTVISYTRSEGREKMLLNESGKPPSVAVVISGTRGVRLYHRKPEGGSWSVETDTANGRFPALKLHGMRLTTAAYSPSGIVGFAELVRSPDFKILEVSRNMDAGADIAKVSFRFSPTVKGKNPLEGWFRLDLGMNWVIRDYEFESRGTTTSSPDGSARNWSVRTNGFVSYRLVDGKPAPTENEIRMRHDRRGETIVNYKISKFVFGSTPPEDFTLAAFGLDDYDRTVSQAQTRSTYRTAVASAAAFVAAFVLFCVGRSIQKSRRKSAAAATSAQTG